MNARPPRPLTFPEFRDYVLRTVKDVERVLSTPDDDWIPVLIVNSPTKPMILSLEMFYGSEMGKDLMASTVFPTAIRTANATAAAFVTSSWFRRYEHGIEAESEEKVLVNVADATNDEMWCASIIRGENVLPTLGEWKPMGDGGEQKGRFSGALLACFDRPRLS